MWLSSFSIHLKLSHCLLIRYTPIQYKNQKKKQYPPGNLKILCLLAIIRSFPTSPEYSFSFTRICVQNYLNFKIIQVSYFLFAECIYTRTHTHTCSHIKRERCLEKINSLLVTLLLLIKSLNFFLNCIQFLLEGACLAHIH